jgi:anaerobic magnesium-protoporphyrin IX monomethyl ester cyclase
MRIALVSLNTYKPIFPPLGLAYLATNLKKETGAEIKVFDANFQEVYEEVIKYSPDIIGITSMTPDYGRAIRFATKIKQIGNTPVIIGGVHVTTLPNSMKTCFDIGVLGEGEQTFVDLVKLFENKREFLKEELKEIEGIIYHDNGEICTTGRRALIKNLDDLPHLDRSYIDERYFERLMWKGQIGKRTHIIAGRGCPFKCAFCSTSLFWERRIRSHSIPYVMEEIKDIYYNYGVTLLDVQDDLFLFKKEKVEELILALKKENLLDKLHWHVNIRVDLASDELFEAFKRLNVLKVGFGFESGCDKTLKFLKSNTVTVADARRAVKQCLSHGLEVGGSFIFAAPGESVADMYETLDLIKEFKRMGVSDLSTFVLTPYPGTVVWDIAKERGKVSDDMDWDVVAQNLEYNALNPMLLDPDIDIKEYRKFFRERGKVMKSFKLSVVKQDFKKNPFWVVWRAIKKPKTTFNILFRRNCYG